MFFLCGSRYKLIHLTCVSFSSSLSLSLLLFLSLSLLILSPGDLASKDFSAKVRDWIDCCMNLTSLSDPWFADSDGSIQHCWDQLVMSGYHVMAYTLEKALSGRCYACEWNRKEKPSYIVSVSLSCIDTIGHVKLFSACFTSAITGNTEAWHDGLHCFCTGHNEGLNRGILRSHILILMAHKNKACFFPRPVTFYTFNETFTTSFNLCAVRGKMADTAMQQSKRPDFLKTLTLHIWFDSLHCEDLRCSIACFALMRRARAVIHSFAIELKHRVQKINL